MEEIQEALAIEIGESTLDPDNVDDIEDIVSVCAGLVIVDQGSVRLVHYTTQEYLRRQSSKHFPEGQQIIASSCVTYLCFEAFRKGMWPNSCKAIKGLSYVSSDQHSWARECGVFSRELDRVITSFPLLNYAAHHWGTHTRGCAELDIKPCILDFLANDDSVSNTFLTLISQDHKETIGGLRTLIFRDPHMTRQQQGSYTLKLNENGPSAGSRGRDLDDSGGHIWMVCHAPGRIPWTGKYLGYAAQ